MTEEQPTPVEESRLRRGLRTTHHAGFYAAVAVAVATVLYLVLLIAENSNPVRVHYVFGSGRTRLIWLIVVTGLVGWVCGLATSFLIRRRFRRDR